jgi:hypothetical protein
MLFEKELTNVKWRRSRWLRWSNFFDDKRLKLSEK